MRLILGFLCAALMLTSCGHPYSLDCGPLDRAACEERATQIVSTVMKAFPSHSVSSIVIVNAAGHAKVLLDDGTEVGFGERLVPSN